MHDEKFVFTSRLKRIIFTTGAIGLVLALIGLWSASLSGGHEDGEHGEGHGEEQHAQVTEESVFQSVAYHQEDTHQEDEHSEGEDHHDDAHADTSSDEGDSDSAMVEDHHHEGDDHGHAAEADDHHDAAAGHGVGDSHAEEGGEHHEGGEGHHGSPSWLKRFFTGLWINNIYFLGIGIIGIFFFAIQYAAQAGWSSVIKRVMLALGNWVGLGALITIVLFFVVKGDVFHWTHADLYEVGGAGFDAIINAKGGYFFAPLDKGSFPLFYIIRMVAFLGIWYFFFTQFKKFSSQEDQLGGDGHFWKMRKWAAIFLVIFAVTSSVAAWDWVMSIDTHWFSTMFGWYVFASWFVTGIAAMILIVTMLRKHGYLKQVTNEHLHDLGKFMFAFSIFWTYIWFSQFLLIYYANIPEESVYYVERLASDYYGPVFFINLGLNFFFPFLVLMTRDAKRHVRFLQIAAVVVMFGHWLDFYLMMTPGIMKEEGNYGLLEIGLTMVFLSAFVFVVMRGLSKLPLIAKNDPMLVESTHHHT